jgi:formylglycine-generating enzyme required for sulfatase activity
MRGFIESFQFKTVPANPQHGITEAFEIQVTPVTQGQLMVWRYATGALDPDHLPVHRGMLNDGSTDHIDLGDGITMNYDHPAESMSYLEAEAMAQWLTDLPASKAAGCGYSVITEPQYLHALHWAFGKGWDGTNDVTFLTDEMVKAHGVYLGNRKGAHTMAVSERKPSPNGPRHMVGNVYTWTKTEIMVEGQGSRRVIWGGSYQTGVGFLRLSDRYYVSPGDRFSNVGVRLVRHCL